MPQTILHPAPFRVPLLDAHGQLVETWRRFFLSTQNLINEILISDRPGLGTPHPALLADDSGADADAWIIPGPPGATGAPGPPGLAGMDGQESDESWWLSGFPAGSGIIDVAHGGTGANLAASAAIGDLLVANAATTFARLADVAVNSVLISKGIGVAPAWADNVNLGTAGSGFLNISGLFALTKTFADDGVIPLTTSLTFPTTITVNRVAINFDVTSAGSSAFSQTGINFVLEPGYTGSARTFAMVVKNGVATALNQAVGLSAVTLAAGLSNCALSGVAQNGTNGNIGVYGGIGGFTEGNFNFNITAAILASNGATTNDIYRGYSSTTLKFAITDAGNITLAGKETKYNNISTVGLGHPAVYGLDSRTGLTAADGAATTLYTTVAANNIFRVSADIFATAAVTGTATYTITWTENATTQTMVVTATVINTLGTVSNLIRPDNATAITAQLTGTFTGTFTVVGLVEQVA